MDYYIIVHCTAQEGLFKMSVAEKATQASLENKQENPELVFER